ncbi:MAG: Hpt domain-containing protein [Deltaproteobacteria bacterium]|nr:Hpt domain-containing protein [Deltaproteobacteria bacterium]
MSNRLYYVLGAFCVFSVLASVTLSHRIMQIYEGSVLVNREWATRSGTYAALGQTITRANGPGNDVFESGDVDAESQRLDATEAELNQLYGAAVADLKNVTPAQRAQLEGELTEVKGEAAAMIKEAREIFRLFRAEDRAAAGAHMAEMDRRLASASGHLDRLTKAVHSIQEDHFSAQLQSAEGVRTGELGLVAMVFVMVAGIVLYGRRLAVVFAKSRAAIDRRNADMTRLLDNVAQGFVTIDRQGHLSAEYSRSLAMFLGTPEPGQTLWTYAGRVDPMFGEWLALSWESILEDALPLEVAIDQLPRRLERAGRIYEFEYRPILEAGRFEQALVVVSDITERVERERAEVYQKEVVALFERIIRDRAGVLEFFAESAELVEAVTARNLPLPTAKRLIHTLKGNSGFFGLSQLTQVCHDLETRLEELGALDPEGVRALSTEWDRVNVTLGHLIGARKNKRLELEASDYEAVLEAVIGGRPRDEIARLLTGWRLEPTSQRLQRIAEQTQALAARLGKGQVTINVEPNKLRTSQDRWAPFWSALTHVVRNAVDHGLESPQERTKLAKSPAGTITLRTEEKDGQVVVEVADDGRGVNWEALGRAAAARGMNVETEADLVEALFADGVSTKDAVSDVSGRGVGMAAVRQVCRALGGAISVTTEAGRGTTFRFSIPKDEIPFSGSTLDVALPAIPVRNADGLNPELN